MEGKRHIAHVRLVDACAAPGCPLCRCVRTESRRYLEALLHEQVTDVDTRRRIRLSWGFCNWHTWMLAETTGAALGVAIVYEDLVTRLLRRSAGKSTPSGRWLRGLRRRRALSSLVELWKRRAPCPACVDAGATEGRYLDVLLASIDDEPLRTVYALSDGLCAPHLVLAVERGDVRADALVARTRQAWARISRDLSAFVGKHDHRTRQPFTEAEAASRARALELLAGAPGVFGHARAHVARPAR
jgi:hypothetical protein